jgi:phosphoglucosamine mutase
MLSGSHNTATDNGIKFFKEDGFKISKAAEEEIEGILQGKSSYPVVENNMLGQLKLGKEYFDNYINHLMTSWKGKQDLSNYRIVVDCVNGATYQIGPKVLRHLGAEVIVLNDKPNGININPDYDTESYDSHKPAKVRELVLSEKANLGIGFDGDGDRVLLVDEQGNYLDGDHMLAILAHDMQKRRSLAKDTVVTTIMRNLGLDVAFQKMGIKLEATPVGDKYVADKMVQNEYVLGGEQAGHILIFEDGNTTGDGIYIALRIAALLVDSGQPLSNLASLVHKYPQKIEHVRNVPSKKSIDEIPGLVEQIEKSEALLARSGPHFINVRYSGTEKGLVRITVKGIIQEEVEQEAYNIAGVIERWKRSVDA